MKVARLALSRESRNISLRSHQNNCKASSKEVTLAEGVFLNNLYSKVSEISVLE